MWGVLLCAFLMGCVPMWNFDIWMHLRTGQLILERQRLPYLDWYSFTDTDRPWISMHWMFQVVVAELYAWGGVPLLVLTKALLQMTTVAVCWRAAGNQLPVWGKSILMLMLVVCLAGRSLVRPDMITNVFLSLWLFVLVRTDDRPRMIWLLPLLQVVWTNCHGLFVLGLVVLGAYCCDRVARSLANGHWWLEKASVNPRLKWVLLAAGVTIMSCLANPYLGRGAMFPLTLFGKLANDPSDEHMPLHEVFHMTWAKAYVLTELMLWAMTLLSFVWLARHRRLSVMRLLLFIGFSYLGWIAVRNIGIFAIVASVICCLNVSDVLEFRFSKAPYVNRDTRRLSLAVLIATVVLMISVVTSAWHRFTGRDPFGIGELKDWYIHGAAEFAGRPGMPSRAFVIDYGQAAVFIFHNSPEHRVFLDGRLEVYRDTTIERYFQIENAIFQRNASFVGLLVDSDQNLPTIVIHNIPAHQQLLAAMLTSPQVRLVYADPAGAVFIQDSLADELQLAPADPTLLHWQEPANPFALPST